MHGDALVCARGPERQLRADVPRAGEQRGVQPLWGCSGGDAPGWEKDVGTEGGGCWLPLERQFRVVSSMPASVWEAATLCKSFLDAHTIKKRAWGEDGESKHLRRLWVWPPQLLT